MKFILYAYVIMSTQDIGKQGFDEIKGLIQSNGYFLKDLGNAEAQGQMVANFEKSFDYNDEEDGSYKNFGTIKINIVFDKQSSGGTRKRIIKRKKTTRRNRKTKK
jgi:hypothetical protein